MTIGAPDFFGPKVKESVAKVTERITKSELYEECGHSLALEKPERLAKDLIEFMLG
jgi:pimeloyl-ACP methyl ester carboxylesterase